MHAQKQEEMGTINKGKLHLSRVEVLVSTATPVGSRLRYETVGYSRTLLTIVHLIACRYISTACYLLTDLDRKLPWWERVVRNHCSTTCARRSGGRRRTGAGWRGRVCLGTPGIQTCFENCLVVKAMHPKLWYGESVNGCQERIAFHCGVWFF